MITNFLAASEVNLGSELGSGVIDLIAQSGPIAQGVLLTLLFFSLISWGIMLDKIWMFRQINKRTRKFARIFQTKESLEQIFFLAVKMKPSPLNNIFQGGYKEYKRIKGADKNTEPFSDAENLSHDENLKPKLVSELSGLVTDEVLKLEKRLVFLATTASATPFIGLFGTVWGIMNAFRGIGSYGSASITAVAPGIAEALITTAAGLAAAIPAVIGYNYINNKIKNFTVQMERFAEEFIGYVT